jgi:hypothetical protein
MLIWSGTSEQHHHIGHIIIFNLFRIPTATTSTLATTTPKTGALTVLLIILKNWRKNVFKLNIQT